MKGISITRLNPPLPSILGLLCLFSSCTSVPVPTDLLAPTREDTLEIGYYNYDGTEGLESDLRWPVVPEGQVLGAYFYSIAPSGLREWDQRHIVMDLQIGRPVIRNFWRAGFGFPPEDFKPTLALETKFPLGPFGPMGPHSIEIRKLPSNLEWEPILLKNLSGPRVIPFMVAQGRCGFKKVKMMATQDWMKGEDYSENFFLVSSIPRFPRPQGIPGQTGDGTWAILAHSQRFLLIDEEGTELGDLQRGRYRIFNTVPLDEVDEIRTLLTSTVALRHFLVYLQWLTTDLKDSPAEVFQSRFNLLGSPP